MKFTFFIHKNEIYKSLDFIISLTYSDSYQKLFIQNKSLYKIYFTQ